MKSVLEIINEIKKARKKSQTHLDNGDYEKYWKFIGKIIALKMVIFDEIKLIKIRGRDLKTKTGNLKIINGQYKSEGKILEALKRKYKNNAI